MRCSDENRGDQAEQPGARAARQRDRRRQQGNALLAGRPSIEPVAAGRPAWSHTSGMPSQPDVAPRDPALRRRSAGQGTIGCAQLEQLGERSWWCTGGGGPEQQQRTFVRSDVRRAGGRAWISHPRAAESVAQAGFFFSTQSGVFSVPGEIIGEVAVPPVACEAWKYMRGHQSFGQLRQARL